MDLIVSPDPVPNCGHDDDWFLVALEGLGGAYNGHVSVDAGYFESMEALFDALHLLPIGRDDTLQTRRRIESLKDHSN